MSTHLNTGVLLEKEIRELNIIHQNSSDNCFKPSSYDLRVGEEAIKTDGTQDSVYKPLRNQKMVVPAFGSLIVQTHEVVRIPPNVVGKFNLRIKMALKGLFVQMGTQVEPNYHGRLFAVLHNITSDDIVLNWQENEDGEEKGGKDRIFTIEFFYTSSKVETKPKYENKISDIQQFIGTNTFFKSTFGTINTSVSCIKDDIKKIRADVEGRDSTILASLKLEFSGYIQAQAAYLEAQKIIDETDRRRQKEKIEEISEFYQDSKSQIEKFEAKVKNDLQIVRDTRKQIVYNFLIGGIGLVFFSVLTPILFSYSLNYFRPLSETDITASTRTSIIEFKKELAQISGNVAESLKNSKQSARKSDRSDDRYETIMNEIRELRNQLERLSKADKSVPQTAPTKN
ncbi:hypothetical protein [uncultured Cohaesibacter sp.]|uniref:dCTP deaminase domain-containing protein n=1 Tax=uncultured Cohaesibacter sp. TaxID=1002546 RepID=UPI002AA6A0EF|nr:hypothetical protein [uncultured Cohaesibacter sp.]